MYENEAVRQELIDLGMDYDRIVCFSNLDLELPEYEKIFHIDAAESAVQKADFTFLKFLACSSVFCQNDLVGETTNS